MEKRQIGCEICHELKIGKDLWWCEADGCHVLICSLCRCTQHPQDHDKFISPFSDLKCADMVYSTLKCANFKQRMAFKKLFLTVADLVWESEPHVHVQIAAAFPRLDSSAERLPNICADLDEERAGLIGAFDRLLLRFPISGVLLRQLLADCGFAGLRDDVLDQMQRVGAPALAELFSEALKMASVESPSPSSASATSSSTPTDPRPSPSPPLTTHKPTTSSGAKPMFSSASQIVVIGGRGRERQIETLFPSKVSAVALFNGACGAASATKTAKLPGVFVFACDKQNKNQVIRYSPNRGTLSIVQPVSASRYVHLDGAATTATLPNNASRIFLCGGIEPETENDSGCELWEDGFWTALPGMTAKRAHFAVVELGGFVYAIAGTGTSANWLCSVERIQVTDTKSGWSGTGVVPDLPERLNSVAAVAFKGRIVVSGGVARNSNKAVRSTYFLKPSERAWSVGPRLNYARFGHGLVVADGKVFAIGGEGDGTVSSAAVAHSIEVLSPTEDSWALLSDKTTLPAVKSAFAVI